ncbi:hypothetical protein KAI65_01605 [Candidatus Parcubacteria bacterium]|nr:hypothetical protein [Candidatus Parcubacteria bacterium]
MALYRTILKRAWENTWRHKYLWFFGLFAALLGNGGELELIFRGFDGPGKNNLYIGMQRILETGFFSKGTLSNMGRMAGEDPFSLFLALMTLFIILVLSLFLLWLSITSQVAIVHNTAKTKHDKEHDFKDGILTGMKNFWPVLSLNIISRLAIAIMFCIIALPLLSEVFKNSGLASGWYIIMFIIFIPLSLAFSFLIKYSIAFVVIKGQKTIQAVKSGWNLFKNNWIISIEMAVVLFFINFLVGLGVILLFLILTVPFLFIILMFSQMAFYFNFWFIIVSSIILFLITIVFIGAMLATFQISSWTYLFMELVSKGGVSKITRIFDKKIKESKA